MFAALRRPYLLPIMAAASLLIVTECAAIAADVSPWEDDAQSSARLISARAITRSGGRVFRAGVEIKLKEGWKTYWRYPGDSGVPPALDFSKSQNLKAVTVRYPAPTRFPDGGGGNSIGYKGAVILPLHVVPQDASKPVTLNLKLDYAVCEKLCVPAEAKLELAADRRRDRERGGASAAEARVPKTAAVGDNGTPQSAPSIARPDRASRASRSMWRRRPACRRSCLPKARPRSGLCPCRSRCRVRPPACSASPSIWMACRPARSLTALS